MNLIFVQVLMRDVLRPYVPEYKGQVTSDDGECKNRFIFSSVHETFD